MPEPRPASSRARQIAGIAVFIALSCAMQEGNAAAGYCITGEFAIGCRSEQLLNELLGEVDNEKAFDKTLRADIKAGACQRFKNGEPVELIETGTDPEHRRMRRPGESDSFWMPASYTQPIARCGTNQAKPATPMKPGHAVRVKPAKGKAGDECVYKSVMTDAEIAACRDEPN